MLKKLAENTKLQVLLVVAAALFTFWPTIENFFYLDEWGSLYEWTHGVPYAYSLFTSHIFRLLFEAFKLDATGYFATGLLVYTLSAVIFYFLVKRIFNNGLVGVVAGLLYATSPVGIKTTTMVWTYIAEGGYPLTIMLLALLYLLLAYIQGRKGLHLFLLFFAFMLFLDLMPRRTFMFLPILVLFDYLFTFKKQIVNLGFLARTAAFFAIFIGYYKYGVTLPKIYSTGTINFVDAAPGYDSHAKVEIAKASLTHAEPLITLMNVLLAGPWLLAGEKLKGYVDPSDIDHVRFLVYGTLVAALALVILAWRVKRQWGQLLLFSLGWIHINILGIYIFSSPGVSDAAHRTLSLASPGYALFMTISGLALYTFFAKKQKGQVKILKRVFFFIFLVVIAGNFLATRHTFEKFNEFHSRPARSFFRDLKRFYPTLPVNSLIFIDAPPSPQIKYQLSRIYGGNNYGGGSTIAVFYPEIKKEEISLVRNMSEVEKFIEGDPSKVERVFAFYYDESGLSDKTQEVREGLRNL